MIHLLKKVISLPVLAHIVLAALSVLWFQLAKGQLDASYAASQHPVDYFTGQTGFSGETIKGYYRAMEDAGTLGIYVRTQMIDFAFILGFLAIGLFVCTLIARLNRAESIGRKTGFLAAMAFVFGGVSDIIENGWSFVMLANPSGFADWLALPYSGFAVLKFGLIASGLMLSLVCMLLALLGRILNKSNIG